MKATGKGRRRASKARPTVAAEQLVCLDRGSTWSRLVLYGGCVASLVGLVLRRSLPPNSPVAPAEAPSSAIEAVSALLSAGDAEGALELAQSALELDGGWAAMHLLKGQALMVLDPSRCVGGTCRQHAAASFAECARLADGALEDDATAWLLEATTDLRGIDGTSPERIATLFDDYAESFEEHLLQDLGYAAPPILAEAAAMVEKHLGRKLDRVLDVGCGTGLVGRELRAAGIEASLECIDLSPKMAQRAKANGYDVVAVCDARSAADDDHCGVAPRPDLAILGDVLVYLDDHDSQRVLRQLGALDVDMVALTLERPAVAVEARVSRGRSDWRTILGPTGRYAHNLAWLVNFMQTDLNFHLYWIAELCDSCPYPPLRYEHSIPVRGTVVVFTRSPAAE